MNNKLDELLDKRVETYYTRLKLAYNKRMSRARDKTYAHSLYMEKAELHFKCKEIVNKEHEGILDKLEESYRLGNPVILAVKKLRVEFNRHDEKIKNEDFSAITKYKEQELVEVEEAVSANETGGLAIQELELQEVVGVVDSEDLARYKEKYNEWQILTDLQLVYMYADQRAKDIFFEFVQKQDIEKPDDPKKEEKAEKETEVQNKEYSNYRRTAAIYLILEHLGVDGKVDFTQKSVSRFLEFLSGVKEGNLYERVNEIYNHGYKKSHYADLRYIRKYFVDMQLPEIANRIDDITMGK